MSTNSFSYASKFREVFVKKDFEKKLVSWFPGHMHKGMKQMQQKLISVDCIIEVHDARIPFSGRNPQFYSKLTAIKPHIFVLNKMDLTDMSFSKSIEEKLKSEKIDNILFTNCKESSKGNVNKILPLAVELIRDTDQFRQAFQEEYNLMVIGIPNVGKSSVINRLRNINLKKKSANPVGAKPGITRSVLERVKICEDPPVYLFDTPGVIQPKLQNIEVGLRLALCCILQDHLVGEELIADYLLFWLNKQRNFSYVEYLGIPNPVDDVRLLLLQVAAVLKKTISIRNTEGSLVVVPDLKAAARHFIGGFRNRAYGRLLLDVDMFK